MPIKLLVSFAIKTLNGFDSNRSIFLILLVLCCGCSASSTRNIEEIQTEIINDNEPSQISDTEIFAAKEKAKPHPDDPLREYLASPTIMPVVDKYDRINGHDSFLNLIRMVAKTEGIPYGTYEGSVKAFDLTLYSKIKAMAAALPVVDGLCGAQQGHSCEFRNGLAGRMSLIRNCETGNRTACFELAKLMSNSGLCHESRRYGKLSCENVSASECEKFRVQARKIKCTFNRFNSKDTLEEHLSGAEFSSRTQEDQKAKEDSRKAEQIADELNGCLTAHSADLLGLDVASLNLKIRTAGVLKRLGGELRKDTAVVLVSAPKDRERNKGIIAALSESHPGVFFEQGELPAEGEPNLNVRASEANRPIFPGGHFFIWVGEPCWTGRDRASVDVGTGRDHPGSGVGMKFLFRLKGGIWVFESSHQTWIE